MGGEKPFSWTHGRGAGLDFSTLCYLLASGTTIPAADSVTLLPALHPPPSKPPLYVPYLDECQCGRDGPGEALKRSADEVAVAKEADVAGSQI